MTLLKPAEKLKEIFKEKNIFRNDDEMHMILGSEECHVNSGDCENINIILKKNGIEYTLPKECLASFEYYRPDPNKEDIRGNVLTDTNS